MPLSRMCTMGDCTAIINTSRARRRHVHKMHGPVPDVCLQCNEPFLADKSLEQHMRSFDHSRARKQPHLRAEGKIPVKKSEAKSTERTFTLSSCRVKSNQECTEHGPLPSCTDCKKTYITSADLEQPLQDNHQSRQRIILGNARHRSHNPQRWSVHISYSEILLRYDDDIFTVGPGSIDSFISLYIQPDKGYLKESEAAVDRLISFLQHSTADNLRSRRVIKCGPFGKGTAVKGKVDLDLILMLNQYQDVRTLSRDMSTLLNELEACIATYPGITVVGRTPHCVKLEISSSKGTTLSADLLPAVDVLQIEKSKEYIYELMGTKDSDIQGFYSTCIAPLQLEMFTNLPTRLKNLIRLMKYWEKEKLCADDDEPKWPSSYAMELVVIQAWTKAGEKTNFDQTKGLHAVLTSLVNHYVFDVIYERHLMYSRRFLPKLQNPYIMDPCNPYNDVYKTWEWHKFARKAKEWLKKPLFNGIVNTSKQWS